MATISAEIDGGVPSTKCNINGTYICGGHIRDEIRHITHMAEMHRRSATQFQQDRNIESKEAPKLKQNNKKQFPTLKEIQYQIMCFIPFL